MSKIDLIGAYPGSLELTAQGYKSLNETNVVIGSQRLLDSLQNYAGEKQLLKLPLEKTFSEIEKFISADKKVAVLADGDPLFYGVGARLFQKFPEEQITVYPNVTTVSLAASKAGIPWNNIQVISLHGRNEYYPLFGLIQRRTNVAVFTDSENTPSRIAQRLVRRGVNGLEMKIFSMLGTSEEKIESGVPEDFLKHDQADLNIVFLLPEKEHNLKATLGCDDRVYIKERGLITKKAVRCTGIGMLDLHDGQTIWDLGAGCGSVAIEASVVARCARVVAVEKNKDRLKMIRENIQQFRAWSIKVVEGEMPDCLDDLPAPDRIFIGGGIGRDSSVIERAAGCLKPGGKMVVHAILLGSIERTVKTFDNLNWRWEAMQIQCSVSDEIAGDHRFQAQNPVTIFMAKKPS
jgi:precorrin-6Y C5,15-methyltransferase (decarboxylating)